VDHGIFKPLETARVRNPERPVFLYAGRLAVEKNIEAFLKLDLPGERWVAGEGPMESMLRKKYPDVRYIGVLPQAELAALYNDADVFVFPSLTDTFGLVMVEAMACGLPVAAYPVAGPIDVVGHSGGGVLHQDLRVACLEAMKIPRGVAISHAAQFTWAAATQQFYDYLEPIKHGAKKVA
jgi:glycosyltransferase involved in cell wall biosynthesis